MSAWITRPLALAGILYTGWLWMHGMPHEAAAAIAFGALAFAALLGPWADTAKKKG